ncbi:MAG: Two-component response regulator [Rickettsiaceae bacterium]|jgi:DNA-binding response OmpR family regulator|nr:Two-component response regulator [Rickettsiaceae bacterium]
MLKNIEVILSYDDILLNQITSYRRLQESDNTEIIHLRNALELAKFRKQYNKITTLIIVDHIETIEQVINYAQNIINLVTNKSYSSKELKLNRPFRLSNFLSQLDLLRSQYNSKIIYLINNAMLFDAKTNSIFYQDQVIRLTDKEAEILKVLLAAPKYSLDKTTLLQEVWGLSKEIDTYTLETHVSKLKLKLPASLFVSKDNIYSLKVSDLQ